MSNWQSWPLSGCLAFIIDGSIDLRKAVNEVQRQVEHLHDVMLDKLEDVARKDNSPIPISADCK